MKGTFSRVRFGRTNVRTREAFQRFSTSVVGRSDRQRETARNSFLRPPGQTWQGEEEEASIRPLIVPQKDLSSLFGPWAKTPREGGGERGKEQRPIEGRKGEQRNTLDVSRRKEGREGGLDQIMSDPPLPSLLDPLNALVSAPPSFSAGGSMGGRGGGGGGSLLCS